VSQLGQVGWNDTESTLDEELQEEDSSINTVVSDISPWVDHGTSTNAADHNGQSSTQEVGEVSNNKTSDKGTDVGKTVGNGGSVVRETQLLGQESWVQVLRTVGHEVKTCHQQNHVNDHEPVNLDGFAGFSQEWVWNDTRLSLHGFSQLLLLECISLWKQSSRDCDDGRNTGCEPVHGSPLVALRVSQCSGENDSKQVAKSVTLLKQTGNETLSSWRTVVKGQSSSITVNTTHDDTEHGSHTQELLKSLDEGASNLNSTHEGQVDHEGPLGSVLVTEETENESTSRSQHKNQSDGPGDVGNGLVKLLGQHVDVKRNGKEVKGIPGPAPESTQNKEPLLTRDLSQTRNRVKEIPVGTHIFLGGEQLSESGLTVVDDRFFGEGRSTHDMFRHWEDLLFFDLLRLDVAYQLRHYEYIRVIKDRGEKIRGNWSRFKPNPTAKILSSQQSPVGSDALNITMQIMQ